MAASLGPDIPYSTILGKVEKALKEFDLKPVQEALRTDDRDLKRAILDKLLMKRSGECSKLEYDRYKFQYAKLMKEIDGDPVIKDYFDSREKDRLVKQHNQPMGSGPDCKPLEQYYCANVDVEKKEFCLKRGIHGCTLCGLVGYCSKDCQRKHWPKHKASCKFSKFRDTVWKPNWEATNRTPAFSAQELSDRTIMPLWSINPAQNVINFPGNEFKDGGVWQEQMRIVFPASGDFGSLVETLASVPVSHDRGIEILINDKDPMIVARNLMMTSLLLLKGEEAIDTVINLWYSALMRHEQVVTLVFHWEQQLLPLVGKKPGTLKSGKSSVELNDMDSIIDLILCLLKNDLGDPYEAMDGRFRVMTNANRQDVVDRQFSELKEFHRESVYRFRGTGQLLPYGSYSAHINQYNKFLFSPGVGWLLSDMADPKEGWDMVKVMEFGDNNRLPKNDLYGRLFFYVRDRLSKMVATMERIPVKIRFFQKDTSDLAKKFGNEKLTFDRVDASNIDIAAALSDWAPLLNKANPHSALITLFHNWNVGSSASGGTSADGVAKFAMECEKLGIRLVQATDLSSSNPMVVMGGKEEAKHGMEFMGLDPSNLESSHTANTFEGYLDKVVKKKPQGVKRRTKHTIVPHRIMFPLDAPSDATLESMEEEKQYCVLNWTKNHASRYVEWGY